MNSLNNLRVKPTKRERELLEVERNTRVQVEKEHTVERERHAYQNGLIDAVLLISDRLANTKAPVQQVRPESFNDFNQ